MSWHRALQWADDWYLPVLDAGDAGHINVASGHGSWPQGLQWFENLHRSTLEIDGDDYFSLRQAYISEGNLLNLASANQATWQVAI